MQIVFLGVCVHNPCHPHLLTPSLRALWLQEDNHSYYMSRFYGPGEARTKELWIDMAEANRSQVKVHGILSNTHRQASVSSLPPLSCCRPCIGHPPWCHASDLGMFPQQLLSSPGFPDLGH